MDHNISKAMQDVIDERQRQVSAEGWTPEHDDEHTGGELAAAAAQYMLVAYEQACGEQGPFLPTPDLWPWSRQDFKPKDQRSNLVRGIALGLAELERLDRQA